VAEGRCVILSGKPGRGKTHLAVAIAYRAIQNGFSSVGDCSPSTGRRCGPSTSDLTTRPHLGHQINRPEFPESSGQNFRNPQTSNRPRRNRHQDARVGGPADQLGGRVSTPFTRSRASRRPNEWLGVRDGIRNWLVSAP
jgi:hypothetical protein